MWNWMGGEVVNRELKELLEKVYPLENPEGCQRKFSKKRKRNTLFTAGAVLFLVVVLLLGKGKEENGMSGGQVVRPEFGSSRVSLVAKYGGYESGVEFKLSARERSGEEVAELFALAKELLKERILNGNPSLLEVTGNLELPEELPEYGMEILWKSSDRKLVSGDGSVHNRELLDAQAMTLTARLCYGDFTEECSYQVMVQPYPYTDEEFLAKRLQDALEASDAETAGEGYLLLPGSVEGNGVTWSEQKQDMTGIFLLLGAVAVFAVYGREVSVLRKKKKEREEELLIDYPDFLSRFILLLGAGMTVRGAWERMLADYQKSGRRRYVYDEMQRTMAQIEVGMPELRAYEQFGRRCGLISYLRFTTILTQNLRKGSSGIAQLLRMEAQEAFSERKNHARKKGEEAGTKLLLPMGGMLVIVFVLILVPAFASFPA